MAQVILCHSHSKKKTLKLIFHKLRSIGQKGETFVSFIFHVLSFELMFDEIPIPSVMTSSCESSIKKREANQRCDSNLDFGDQ
jgi:hypothetical protein